MFVSKCMTRDPIVITPQTTVPQAVALMKKHKIHRLPVLEHDKLIGIVSDGDLEKVSPSAATTLAAYEIPEYMDKLHVKDVMSKNVISIRDDAALEEAAYLLDRNNIGGVPVISDVGVVIGIITYRDILRAFINIMRLEDGKTRITLEVQDKIGALQDIAGILAGEGISIDSLVTYKEEGNAYQIVIRGDIPNVLATKAKLEAHGYKLISAVSIR